MSSAIWVRSANCRNSCRRGCSRARGVLCGLGAAGKNGRGRWRDRRRWSRGFGTTAASDCLVEVVGPEVESALFCDAVEILKVVSRWHMCNLGPRFFQQCLLLARTSWVRKCLFWLPHPSGYIRLRTYTDVSEQYFGRDKNASSVNARSVTMSARAPTFAGFHYTSRKILMRVRYSRSLIVCLSASLAWSQQAPPASAPAPKAVDPIAVMVGRLSLDRYKATVKGLTQFGDRRQGTDRNRAAVDWIEAQLKSYGCTNTERIQYDYQPVPRPAGGGGGGRAGCGSDRWARVARGGEAISCPNR